jgi:hypothetical protein
MLLDKVLLLLALEVLDCISFRFSSLLAMMDSALSELF